MVWYDISQNLTEKIAVWPGDQKFRRRWSMRIAEGDSCNVSAVTMSVHTGTHMDAPYHFDDEGLDIASVPLDVCIGRARVVCVPPDQEEISVAFLESLSWGEVRRVLFRTRSSEVGVEKFQRDYTFLTQEGARFLAGLSIQLVGTDAPSIDAFSSKTLGAHKILLAGGVTILEGIRLSNILAGDYELICLPLKLSGLDGSPVRAVLRSL